MKRFVISFILVFALTSHAYGMGWMGGDAGHNDSGSVIKTSGNTKSGPAGTAGNDNGGKNEGGRGINNSGFITTTSTSDGRDRDGHDGSYGQYGSNTLAVPEPFTLLLLGSGLIGIVALRKKFKK
jgi:hypothetical protein